MPTTWMKGLIAWLSGLIFAVAMIIMSAQASATPEQEGVAAADLELPVLSRTHSLVERTV